MPWGKNQGSIYGSRRSLTQKEKIMAKIKMKTMLESGVHFGHRSRFWHPKMAPYIYGIRNDIHIINLEKTLPLFNDALNFVGQSISQGKKILFVGTKRSAANIIKDEAIRCEMPYVNHRWLGGMMTNYKTIKASIKRLKDLEFLAQENFSSVNKKEGLMMHREMEKLERSLGGIKDLGGIPDILFVMDIGHEKIAIKEAKKLGLPIIAVVDTNYNPEGIDYVIPGNDDSIRSIGFYTREVTNAILEAKASMLQNKTVDKKPVATVVKKVETPAKTPDTPAKVAEKTTEKPTIKTIEKPTIKTVAKVVKKIETPAKTPIDTPAKVAEKPAIQPAIQPAIKTVAKLVKKVETPAKTPDTPAKVTEKTTEKPAIKTVAEKTTEKPAIQPTIKTAVETAVETDNKKG